LARSFDGISPKLPWSSIGGGILPSYEESVKWTPSQGQFSPKLRCASFCRLTE